MKTKFKKTCTIFFLIFGSTILTPYQKNSESKFVGSQLIRIQSALFPSSGFRHTLPVEYYCNNMLIMFQCVITKETKAMHK
jgi:hypothetical protein